VDSSTDRVENTNQSSSRTNLENGDI
jgi:hypothetical protein